SRPRAAPAGWTSRTRGSPSGSTAVSTSCTRRWSARRSRSVRSRSRTGSSGSRGRTGSWWRGPCRAGGALRRRRLPQLHPPHLSQPQHPAHAVPHEECDDGEGGGEAGPDPGGPERRVEAEGVGGGHTDPPVSERGQDGGDLGVGGAAQEEDPADLSAVEELKRGGE